MGTPAFSVGILEGLVEEGYDVMAVVTQPDRPVGRKRVMTPPPVKAKALELGLTVVQPEKIRELDYEPDFIVTAAFGQFLPESVLARAKVKAINVHASLLPKYRGAAPIHYALINGDALTGISIIEMTKKMDAGDIYGSSELAITDDDNVGTLFEKLSVVGRDTLLSVMPGILDGSAVGVPQVESEVTFSPSISADEEIIDWSLSAREVFNKIRGMNPFPTAYSTYDGERVKFFDTRVVVGSGAPGEIILKDKKNFVVACGTGALSVKVLQPFGKSKMDVVSFLNGVGQKYEIGSVFN
jgi:methionyl-tRNA formyltransferase